MRLIVAAAVRENARIRFLIDCLTSLYRVQPAHCYVFNAAETECNQVENHFSVYMRCQSRCARVTRHIKAQILAQNQSSARSLNTKFVAFINKIIYNKRDTISALSSNDGE